MDANKPDLCFLLISTRRSLLLAIQRLAFKLFNLTEGGVFTPQIVSNFIFCFNLLFLFVWECSCCKAELPFQEVISTFEDLLPCFF